MSIAEEDCFQADCFQADKSSDKNNDDIIPYSVLLIKNVQGKSVSKPLTVLFDSGANTSWINRKCLPEAIKLNHINRVKSSTLAGHLQTSNSIKLDEIVFPELHRHRVIKNMTPYVFDNPDCRYDVLIGRDFCREHGIILDFKESLIEWDESTCNMRAFPTHDAYAVADDKLLSVGEHLLHELLFSDYLNDEDISSEKESETLASAITHLEANTYRKFDIPEIISGCNHLNKEQQEQLTNVLVKYPQLFSGRLREFKDYQVTFDLEQGCGVFAGIRFGQENGQKRGGRGQR